MADQLLAIFDQGESSAPITVERGRFGCRAGLTSSLCATGDLHRHMQSLLPRANVRQLYGSDNSSKWL